MQTQGSPPAEIPQEPTTSGKDEEEVISSSPLMAAPFGQEKHEEDINEVKDTHIHQTGSVQIPEKTGKKVEHLGLPAEIPQEHVTTEEDEERVSFDSPLLKAPSGQEKHSQDINKVKQSHQGRSDQIVAEKVVTHGGEDYKMKKSTGNESEKYKRTGGYIAVANEFTLYKKENLSIELVHGSHPKRDTLSHGAVTVNLGRDRTIRIEYKDEYSNESKC